MKPTVLQDLSYGMYAVGVKDLKGRPSACIVTSVMQISKMTQAGPALVASLIDMGGRLRLIVQDIECVKPILPMPNLPVARVMWRALPNLTTGVECWITAGGAHHTVLSYDVDAEMLRDWARIMDIEFVHIGADTTPEKLEEELLVKDLVWKLK